MGAEHYCSHCEKLLPAASVWCDSCGCEASYLADLLWQNLGFRAKGLKGRFLAPGWVLDETFRLTCPDCGHRLHVARKFYRNAHGVACRYSALICRPCGRVSEPKQLPATLQSQIRKQSSAAKAALPARPRGAVQPIAPHSAKSLREQALAWLRIVLANPKADFREGQWEAVEEVVERRGRLLVVQRTGWGKSLVYFLATRLLRDRGGGFTLLVSPLLALMRNQLQAAERLGVRAVTINSTNPSEWKHCREALSNDEVDLLMISPERLANDDFVTDTLMPIARRVGTLVVDEAHCISDWGHDFRPDYRRIVAIMRHLPSSVPVLCTTATATQRVLDDLVGQFGELKIQRGPLARLSLSLQALRLEEPSARLALLAETLARLPGSGIIYALTQPDTEMVASWLRSRDHNVHAYHAGLKDEARVVLEQSLLGNQVKALAATSALGMGFDKPDLGFVIHFQAPPSVIHYYQQVGRAGRAVPEAYGILLSGSEELEIAEYFRRTAFPAEESVLSVLRSLEKAGDDGLSLSELQAAVNLRKGQIAQVLKVLAVEDPPPIVCEKSRWKLIRDSYLVDSARVARLSAQREREAEELQALVASRSCLMEQIQILLEDPSAARCGRCSNCLGGPLFPENPDPALEEQARAFLNLQDISLPPRKRWVHALPSYAWCEGSIPGELRSEEGRILARWGHGLGALVRDGKRSGSFSPRLVDAAARLVWRWSPVPAPVWLTYVPSLRRPALMDEFARAVAERLGVRFLAAVLQVRPTAPQKTRENSAFQCANLDGAYMVSNDIPLQSVLLLDDVVDSRWTLTIVGALLRRAGVPAVFPLALASSKPGDR